MKIKTKFIKRLIVCFILMLVISKTSFATTKVFPVKNVNKDKVFSVKFNYDINPSTIKDKIIVKDTNGNIINTTASVENNVIKVTPPKYGYQGGTYTLNILDGIKSISNKLTKYNYNMKFNVVTTSANIGNLKVHYINVGQGDSILIQQDEHNMLIDAGSNKTSSTVANYLKSKGVNKLDYVIATHPHEDHIGGMAYVINNFNVNKFMMAKVTHTSNTFKNMVSALKNKGLKITVPNVGDKYNLGTSTFTIVAPNSNKYNNLNNYSIVTKLKFGNNSFLFTGDAESLSEGEILAKQLDIQSDVLKLGHHGSKTSSTTSFLDKVNPKYAIVSCGKENSYRHPHRVTMDNLQSRNIKVYRTDESGTVISTSDGENITFNCKEGTYNYGDNNSTSISNNTTGIGLVKPKPTSKQNNDIVGKQSDKSHNNGSVVNNTIISKQGKVYYTAKGKCYHSIKSCPTLRRSKNIMTGTASNCGGRRPCSKCN